jgi:hypothetical protein
MVLHSIAMLSWTVSILNMRLLHTKSVNLQTFYGRAIPPYAILSHTWSRGEVSFQDMQNETASSMAGYDKIRRCCETASANGLQYAWVDTCCIDKTSSAELSEAINSMFSWYRLAEVCYAYLEDVTDRHFTYPTLWNSRWFKRGWTLQELIAPSNLIFYNNQWKKLGTKDSSMISVSRITGIDWKVLRDAENIDEFSIAQRMSWASGRETTRVEDTAYCLMGLFGINMPMLYGEGDRAFIRLQEEIMKSTNDHTIFAWDHHTYGTEAHNFGLLAPIPATFKSSRRFVSSKHMRSSPSFFMNGGVHLNVRMWQPKTDKDSNRYLAVLDCQERALENPKDDSENTVDKGENVVLYLEKEPDQPRTFTRRQDGTPHGGRVLATIPTADIR